MNNNTIWTDAQHKILRDNWGIISAQAISDLPGMHDKTRNAVIGKAYKLNLMVTNGSMLKLSAPQLSKPSFEQRESTAKEVIQRIGEKDKENPHGFWVMYV